MPRAGEPRPCYDCGKTKPADAFDWGGGTRIRRRLRVCRQCLTERAEAKEQARLARQVAWTRDDGVRVRRCASVCGRVLVEAENFYIEHRNERAVRYGSYCKSCRGQMRDAWLAKQMQDPEEAARIRALWTAARQRYVEKNRDLVAEQRRASRRRIREDPVAGDAHREKERMDYRIREARRRGQPTPVPEVPVQANGETTDSFPALPSAPLVPKILEYTDRTSYAANAGYLYGRRKQLRAVCEKTLHISQGTFDAWESGEAPTASFGQVDRVLTATGWLWFEVYCEETLTLPDGSPDREALALVERAFTGEGVDVDEPAADLLVAA